MPWTGSLSHEVGCLSWYAVMTAAPVAANSPSFDDAAPAERTATVDANRLLDWDANRAADLANMIIFIVPGPCLLGV